MPDIWPRICHIEVKASITLQTCCFSNIFSYTPLNGCKGISIGPFLIQVVHWLLGFARRVRRVRWPLYHLSRAFYLNRKEVGYSEGTDHSVLTMIFNEAHCLFVCVHVKVRKDYAWLLVNRWNVETKSINGWQCWKIIERACFVNQKKFKKYPRYCWNVWISCMLTDNFIVRVPELSPSFTQEASFMAIILFLANSDLFPAAILMPEPQKNKISGF